MRLSSATLGAVLVGFLSPMATAQQSALPKSKEMPAAPALPVRANAPLVAAGRIEGKVVAVSASSGLVQVDIGSDAKLKVGDTIHVYRPGNLPRYLGTVKINNVTAKASVGQFKPIDKKRNPRIQSGDRVTDKSPAKM
jgi:hypothetical protein